MATVFKSKANARFAQARASKQAPRLPCRSVQTVRCQAQQNGFAADAAKKMAAAGAAALLSMAPLSGAAIASEFDILAEPLPTNTFFVDDAGVLSKSTRTSINKKLNALQIETGYRLEVVTVRKLEFETDAFAFADKVIENWYPTAEEGDKKGVLLVVTAGKEGALSGGPSFMKAVGDDLIDSLVNDNIPIFTEEEKYNQTVTSCIERLEAQLEGKEVPGGQPEQAAAAAAAAAAASIAAGAGADAGGIDAAAAAPKRNDQARERTYKTKEETDKAKTVTSTVVLALLFIAVVVPMLQYYGYTARD